MPTPPTTVNVPVHCISTRKGFLKTIALTVQKSYTRFYSYLVHNQNNESQRTIPKRYPSHQIQQATTESSPDPPNNTETNKADKPLQSNSIDPALPTRNNSVVPINPNRIPAFLIPPAILVGIDQYLYKSRISN
jgi:hypothetical protein